MNHIELALSVLKEKIAKLNDCLKYGHNLPEYEEEIMEKLQKLNHAVNDISDKFNV